MTGVVQAVERTALDTDFCPMILNRILQLVAQFRQQVGRPGARAGPGGDVVGLVCIDPCMASINWLGRPGSVLECLQCAIVPGNGVLVPFQSLFMFIDTCVDAFPGQHHDGITLLGIQRRVKSRDVGVVVPILPCGAMVVVTSPIDDGIHRRSVETDVSGLVLDTKYQVGLGGGGVGGVHRMVTFVVMVARLARMATN